MNFQGGNMKKLIKSFGYALRGIGHAFKSESNMKIHLAITIIVIAGGFLLHISLSEWLVCIACFGLVFGAELMNTSIEKLVDIVSPEHNPKAGRVKDLAAGAVLVCVVFSVIIGIVIFAPKIWHLLF